MKLVQAHRYHGDITALELGYGLIGRPLMNVHVFLVGSTLIDCGQTRMAKEMRDFIARHRIDRILLTHHHEDHSGNAAMIAAHCRAIVMGHPLTALKMHNIRSILPYQHLIWGQSQRIDVAPLPEVVEDGRFRLLPIHTPGHSKDHMVYLEQENGWLFSGDLYLGRRIKFFRSDEKIDQQITSLQKILQYDFQALFCAHNPVLKDARQKIRGKLTYLEEVAGQARRLQAQGLSEREVIRRMDKGQDRRVKWLTMGNVSYANMVRSALRST